MLIVLLWAGLSGCSPTEYADKQVFYAYTDKKFYQLTVDYEGVRTIVVVTGYETYVGRQGLYFQYRHNAPLSRRIDPGTTNIIDLYLITQSYYIAYQNYIRDSTGTITEPAKPTIDELTTSYSTLDQYKVQLINSEPSMPLFTSQKGGHFSANTMCQLFLNVFSDCGLKGASSHTPRRTFITCLANKGIGVRVLAELAGHSSIAVTQRYIDVNDTQLAQAVELVKFNA